MKEDTMRKTLFPAALAAAMTLAGGALASSEAIDTEDDELEAYAVRDEHRYEIYVSTETGAVTKVKADD
jgi:hypothetical protein